MRSEGACTALPVRFAFDFLPRQADTLDRHGRACPGHPRSSRNKQGRGCPGRRREAKLRRLARARRREMRLVALLPHGAASYTFAFSRRECARGVREFSAFPREGRGECRVPTHPQPRMQSKKAYELVTTGKPDDPAFPHAMVLTVSFVISPVIGLVCHRRFASAAKVDASVEASGPHDLAVRVQHRSSAVPNSVHRIPPRVRDDRERPLVGRDGAIKQVFCLGEEARYFFGLGWTGVLRNSPSAVIASAAKQSSFERQAGLGQAGLLRRFAPRNDGSSDWRALVTHSSARRPSARTHRFPPKLEQSPLERTGVLLLA